MSLLLVMLLTGGGVGCTVVPAVEFAGYREAFDDARTAGEEVLLDYSAATVEHAALAAGDGAPATAPAGLGSDDRFALDVDRVVDRAGGVDEVAVRLQAWAVVAAYNDALTRLAEGRSQDDVGAAVGGLLEALRGFPAEAISSAAAGVVPFAGVLTTAVAQVERELSARRFAGAVRAAAPAIRGQFIPLLREDAKSFYNIRYGLNTQRVADVTARAGSLRRAYRRAASGSQAGGDLDALTGRVNRALSRIRGWRAAELTVAPAADAAPFSPDAEARLVPLVLDVEAAGARAAALDAELLAYREVVVEYVRLLGALERQLASLLQAVDEGRRTVPSAAELARVVTDVRRAIALYREGRAS